MALSNWDTLAVDFKGNSIEGAIQSKGGVRVHFYKNWLYIHDEKAWRKGGFSEPTIMQIDRGVVHYHDVYIHAIRGPQNGIFAVIYWHHRLDKKHFEMRGMIGCGVYGFSGARWTGVTSESREFLKKFILSKEDTWPIFPQEIASVDLSKALRFNQGDAYFAHHLGKDGSVLI